MILFEALSSIIIIFAAFYGLFLGGCMKNQQFYIRNKDKFKQYYCAGVSALCTCFAVCAEKRFLLRRAQPHFAVHGYKHNSYYFSCVSFHTLSRNKNKKGVNDRRGKIRRSHNPQ